MSAGRLPAPGTKFGPCIPTCKHVDCAATREDATATCRFCLEPIGYECRFYREASGTKLVHALCLEDDVEHSRKGGAA